MNKKELLKLINSLPQDTSVEEICDWLKKHEDDEQLQEIFEKLIAKRLNENLIVWAMSWFESSLDAASNLLPSLIDAAPASAKQKLLDLGKRLIFSNPDSTDAAYLASQLIKNYQQTDLIDWAKVWLNTHQENTSSVLIHSLLLTQPNEDTISRAQDWLQKNKRDWYSNIILSTLLKVAPDQDILKEAINKLEYDNESPEVVLLIDPLVRAGSDGPTFVAKWISINPNHTLTQDILLEAFRADPKYFVDVLTEWIAGHQDKLDIGLCLEAKGWAHLNAEHEQSAKLLSYLKAKA